MHNLGTDVTWQDTVRRIMRGRRPSVRPFFGQPAISKPLSDQSQSAAPHAGLVVDPMLSLAGAEENFHAQSIDSGFGILHDGSGIDTAADEQNVNAARDSMQASSPTMDMPPAPPDLLHPHERKRFLEPFNDPLSTVPGGMAYGPIKPPGWFPPGA